MFISLTYEYSSLTNITSLPIFICCQRSIITNMPFLPTLFITNIIYQYYLPIFVNLMTNTLVLNSPLRLYFVHVVLPSAGRLVNISGRAGPTCLHKLAYYYHLCLQEEWWKGGRSVEGWEFPQSHIK